VQLVVVVVDSLAIEVSRKRVSEHVQIAEILGRRRSHTGLIHV